MLAFDELSGAIGYGAMLPMGPAPAPAAPAAPAAAPSGAPGKAKGKAGKAAAAPATSVAAKPVAPKVPVARDDTGPLPDLIGNSNLPGCESRGRYYVTTAISYTNGLPHIGHAYESLTADVLARWNRVYGRRVFSMTGTDEHGQKIANAAEAQVSSDACELRRNSAARHLFFSSSLFSVLA